MSNIMSIDPNKAYNGIMITCKLDDLIWMKRTSAKKVHEATGISKSVISTMRNNKNTLYSAKTLSVLCKFFNCKVSDILEYTPD